MQGHIARTSRARAPKTAAIFVFQLGDYNINKRSKKSNIATRGVWQEQEAEASHEVVSVHPWTSDIVRGVGGTGLLHDVRGCVPHASGSRVET